MCGPAEDEMLRARRRLEAELADIKRSEPEEDRILAVVRALVRFADDYDVERHIRRLRLGKALKL